VVPWAYSNQLANGTIGLAVLQGSRTWSTDTETTLLRLPHLMHRVTAMLMLMSIIITIVAAIVHCTVY